MSTLRSSVALASVFLSACALGCASDSSPPVASIGLALTLPKGLVDVDNVKLYVYDQAEVACKGAAITVPTDSAARVFELKLAKCNANKQWCGSGSIEKNPDRVLTFYVEGRYDAKKGGFTGCVERAVDQDPLQVELKAQPLIEGVKCGDAAVGYGETCDPGGGAGDDACDAAKCQTKELVLSNGKAVNRFYRGLPARKTRIGINWVGDRFFGMWSDGAMNSDGGDGPNDVTARRLLADLLVDTSPSVLASEVRLPAGTDSPNSNGGAKRGSVDTAPVFVPVAGGNILSLFLRDDQLNAFVHDNRFNGSAADVAVGSGGGQSDPHAASSSTGDALIVYVQAGAVKSILRKSDGTLGAPQLLGSGTVSSPRVAWVGSDYVVVWSDGNDIKWRRSGPDGVPKSVEDKVNKGKDAGVQDQPSIAAFDTGEFLVAWRDAAGDAGADIRVQKFGKDGLPTGTNEGGSILNDLVKEGDQDQPAVAAGRTPGGIRFYAVVWRTKDNIGGRFVKVDEQGFLVNHASAATSEFSAGVDARPRSSPAVAIGTTAPYVAIAWSDDTDLPASEDDDRVRVRRFPMPDPPK